MSYNTQGEFEESVGGGETKQGLMLFQQNLENAEMRTKSGCKSDTDNKNCRSQNSEFQ